MKNHAAFDATRVTFIYFVAIDLPSGLVLANTSDRDITVTYEGAPTLFKGVGTLGTISDCEVASGTEAKTVSFELNGIPSSMMGLLINENARNRTIKAMIAVCNSDGTLITELITFFQGSIDSMTVSADVSASASLSATSRLINWKRAVNSRFTNEDQLAKYPNDKGFQFVSSLLETTLTWGGV